jgi:type II secretory pathway pseudopilin PulG
MWEILLLVLIVGFFAAIAIPNFNHNGRGNPTNACINNLRQIDAAVNQFALEHQLTNGDRINFPNDLTPYIKLNSQGKIPSCPSGGIYHVGRIGKNPTCSLSTLTPAHALPE